MIILGMMSGTSTDGIDAVVVRFADSQTNGNTPQFEILKHVSFQFAPTQRAEILASLRADTGTVDRICALNFELGATYANAALQAIQAAGLTPADVTLIGNHGQTLWHIPNHSTLQVGSPAVIAERTGITTISNFRSRDIAAGGHGAPMVAFVDQLLFTHPTITRGLQNIGGIANVTYLPAGKPNESFAFDSGPGNVLIDDAVRRATNGAQEYDDSGAIAARGTVNPALLDELMAHPYLKESPPKTTGREIFGTPFGGEVWEQAMEKGISPDDVIATLTMFTAK